MTLQSNRSNRSRADHQVMRQLNRSLVLDMIQRSGRISRAELARQTSLAKPTVSAIVDALITEGLVREVGAQPVPGGGRPPMLLEFEARSQYIAGVQIGADRTNLVVADALGRELVRTTVATPVGTPRRGLRRIARDVLTLLDSSGVARERLGGVGVCLPGLVEPYTGMCLLAPNLGWRQKVPVGPILTEMFEVPVHVINTADAAVALETIDGAAQGVKDVALLYVGRGISAGIRLDHRALHGRRGVVSSLGHCHVPGLTAACHCGKIGCLETAADGPAIARAAEAALDAGRSSSLAEVRSTAGKLTGLHVGHAAAEGDELAQEVLAEAGRLLGWAASWLINLFNPEVILIGGGVAGAGEYLIDPLREAAFEHAVPQIAERVDIRPWTTGRDAGVTGAVLLALEGSTRRGREIWLSKSP